MQAQSGDVLVLYSDGITDHLNPSGTEFGRSRLAQAVRTHCRLSAGDLIGLIFSDLDRWSTTAFDDQTLFVMKVK